MQLIFSSPVRFVSEDSAAVPGAVQSFDSPPPPDGPDVGVPLELPSDVLRDDGSEDKVLERIVKLRDQAMTLEHSLVHFPKNLSLMFAITLAC